MKIFSFIFLFFSMFYFSQQTLSGKITDEEENPLSNVLVRNMKTGAESYTVIDGSFSVTGSRGDEIRFIKANFERVAVRFNEEISRKITIALIRVAVLIEEIKLPSIRLTGDLNKDAAALSRIDKIEKLQAEIGVPKPPEKSREKPAEFKNDVLMPLLALSLKPEAIYDLISGDARRKKSLYRYEDLRDNIAWIKKRMDDDYFTESGIPAEHIDRFLTFALTEDVTINGAVKANNLSKVLFRIEPLMPVYLNLVK